MRVRTGLVVKQMGKKWVVYDVKNSRLHELNEVAGELVRKIGRKGKTKEELLKWLRDSYEVSEQTASQDLKKFLLQLTGARIVEDEDELGKQGFGRKNKQEDEA